MTKENPDLLLSMMREDTQTKEMPMNESKGKVTLMVDGQEMTDPKEIAKYVYKNMPEELEACKEEKMGGEETSEEPTMDPEDESSLDGLNLR